MGRGMLQQGCLQQPPITTRLSEKLQKAFYCNENNDQGQQ